MIYSVTRIFSKKEEYLNGKETDFQKNGRKHLTGTLAGLGTVDGAGYLSGKHHEKKVHEKEDKNIATYKKASEHDKKYLRDKRYKKDMMKIEKEKLKEQKKQTATARQTAWNTSRWYSKKEFSETPFERSQRLEKSANQFKTRDELEKNISELKQILKQNKENYKEFGKYLPSYDRNMARGRNWGLQKTIEQKETYLNNWDKIKQEEKSKRRKDNLKALGYAGAALVSAPIIGIGVGKLLK